MSFSFLCLVPQPDPNTPKPEGRQIIPVKGEPLGVVSNWPPALQAALARWGATQAKSPALTVLDITGKPLYTLTYGEQNLEIKQLKLLVEPLGLYSYRSDFHVCVIMSTLRKCLVNELHQMNRYLHFSSSGFKAAVTCGVE